MNLFLILFSWILPISITEIYVLADYQLKICIKDTPKSRLAKIAAENFKDLVCHSDVVVDKSLLINSILGAESVVKLTYPGKWGKSTNLDMFRWFLEMEINSKGKRVPANTTWGYKYFKKGEIINEDGISEKLTHPPVIAQHKEVVDEYLGKCPVVLLNLSAIVSGTNTFDQFIDSFRRAVGVIYAKYDYLVDILQDRIDNATVLNKPFKDLKCLFEKFQKYKKVKEHDHEEMVQSLDFLSTLLYREYGRRVFVMIDDYDALIKKAYLEHPSLMSNDEASKYLQFHTSLMQQTFAEDKSQSRKGVLTGIHSLDIGLTHLSPNQILHYNILNKNAYPFYGFTVIEANQMLKCAQICEHEIQQALDYYNGYFMGDFPDVVIYSPWSIVNFLNHRQIRNYWSDTEKLETLPHLLKHDDVRTMFQALIGRSVDAQIHRHDLTLNRTDVVLLKEIIIPDDNPAPLDSESFGLIFVLYFATGYLTLDFNLQYTYWPTEIHMKIPCREVEIRIIDELVTYHRNVFGARISELANITASSLNKHLPYYADNTLKDRLKKFYGALFNHSSFKERGQKWVDSAHFLMLLYLRTRSNFQYHVALNASYYKDKPKQKLTPYITIYDKEIGIVIGFESASTKPKKTKSRWWGNSLWSYELSYANKLNMYHLANYKDYFAMKSIKEIYYLHIYYLYTTNKLSIAKEVATLE